LMLLLAAIVSLMAIAASRKVTSSRASISR
jgi:hypothetical protein